MYIGRVTEIVPASEATLSRSLASSIGDQAPVDQNKRVVVFVVADIDETVMGFGSLTLAAPDNYDSAIGGGDYGGLCPSNSRSARYWDPYLYRIGTASASE